MTIEEKRLFLVAIPTVETTVNFQFMADSQQEAMQKVQRTLAEALQQVSEAIGGGKA